MSGFIQPHAKEFMQEFDLILQYQDVIESLEDSRRTSGDRSNTQTLAKAQVISPTPDQDFHCFYPCNIILSHILIPACRKGKNRTAARQPHTGRTSIHDVIVKLKLRRHFAS